MRISEWATHALGEDTGRRWLTRGLILLALVSAMAWGWVWRMAIQATVPLAEPARPMPPARLPEATALGHALGAPTPGPAPEPAQRFRLLGLIATASGGGTALMAVDGQPPRPFAIGAEVAPGFVLQRLSASDALLGETRDGPVRLRLRLPEALPGGDAATVPAEGAGLASPQVPQATPAPARDNPRGP